MFFGILFAGDGTRFTAVAACFPRPPVPSVGATAAAGERVQKADKNLKCSLALDPHETLVVIRAIGVFATAVVK